MSKSEQRVQHLLRLDALCGGFRHTRFDTLNASTPASTLLAVFNNVGAGTLDGDGATDGDAAADPDDAGDAKRLHKFCVQLLEHKGRGKRASVVMEKLPHVLSKIVRHSTGGKAPNDACRAAVAAALWHSGLAQAAWDLTETIRVRGHVHASW